MPNTSKKRKAANLDGERPDSRSYTSKSTKKGSQKKRKSPTTQDEIPFSTESPLKKSLPGDDAFVGTEQLADSLHFEYAVRPGVRWREMRSYRNVKYSGNDFSIGSIVYINRSSPPPKPPPDGASEAQVLAYDRSNFWVARIADTRAENDREVYLRVYWLYWPEELPMGRQPYHADNELVLSNAMDIIDAQTISSIADVSRWDESNLEEPVNDRFWRQTFDIGLLGKNNNGGLSKLNVHCRCQLPHNPDRNMYQCRDPSCGMWNHEQCLLDDARERAQGGSNGLTTPPCDELKVEDEDSKEGLRFLSPFRDLSRFVQNNVLPAMHIATHPSTDHETNKALGSDEAASGHLNLPTPSEQHLAHRSRPHKIIQSSPQLSPSTFDVRLIEPDSEEVPLRVQITELLSQPQKKKRKSLQPGRSWQISAQCLKCRKSMD